MYFRRAFPIDVSHPHQKSSRAAPPKGWLPTHHLPVEAWLSGLGWASRWARLILNPYGPIQPLAQSGIDKQLQLVSNKSKDLFIQRFHQRDGTQLIRMSAWFPWSRQHCGITGGESVHHFCKHPIRRTASSRGAPCQTTAGRNGTATDLFGCNFIMAASSCARQKGMPGASTAPVTSRGGPCHACGTPSLLLDNVWIHRELYFIPYPICSM